MPSLFVIEQLQLTHALIVDFQCNIQHFSLTRECDSSATEVQELENSTNAIQDWPEKTVMSGTSEAPAVMQSM